MVYTDSFRKQHEDILSADQAIIAQLNVAGIQSASDNIRLALSQLSGKLSIHLAMEDKSLYPRLLTSSDADTRRIAQEFMTEMGGLGAAFNDYNKKWTAQAIKADANGFIKETNAVFSALSQRIARENTQLYPLVDKEI